jgi:cellulose synthase operon protein C
MNSESTTVFRISLKRLTAVVAIGILATAFSGCSRSPEQKSARFMANGKKLLEKRDPANAILEFRNAVQVAPGNAEANYQLGMAYIANKNYASAVVSLRKALEINPKHVEAQFRIAQLMAQTDNQVLLEDAQTQLKALMESTSATPEMLKTLAWAELKLGDIDSADETLTRALKEFPLDLGTYLIRAKTRLGQNDMKGAEEALNSGAENLPKSSDAHRVLGEFYLTQKRLGEAEPQFGWPSGLSQIMRRP